MPPVDADRNGAIYGRVSTSQQEEGTSLDTQEEGCLNLAESVGCPVDDRFIWREQGSGADRHRTGFRELQMLIESRAFTDVFVFAPDRIARDPLDLLNFCRLCTEADVQLHFVVGPSGNDEYAELVRFVTGFAGKQERQMIAERTNRGKIATARSGRMPNGAGIGMYGYDYDKLTKKRTINEAEANIVRKMFRDVIAAKSLFRIAVELNQEGIPTKSGKKWHPLTIKRILHNTALYGRNYYGQTKSYMDREGRRKTVARPPEEWIEIWGFTPPIVSEYTFKRAQEQMGRPFAVNAAPRIYLLTGFAFCATCSTPLSGASRMGKKRQYRCRATYATAVDPMTCHESYMNADEIEAIVWDEVVKALKNPQALIRDLERHLKGGGGNIGEEMSELKREISKLVRQEANFIAMASDPDSFDKEMVARQSAPVVALLKEKRRELEILEAQQARHDDVAVIEKQLVDYCNIIAENIDSIESPDGKRDTFSAFDVKVWATKNSVKIVAQVNPEEVSSKSTNVTTIARTLALRHEHIHRLPLA